MTYGRDQVLDIINSVLGKIEEPHVISKDVLTEELLTLKVAVVDLRRQLNAVQPDDLAPHVITTARDELDAVVGATEQATTTIMDACEVILSQMEGSDPALMRQVEAEIVKIFEACTFQDITGQRIAKVIRALRQIDEQISKVLGTLDQQLIMLGRDEPGALSGGDGLLNGPQLPQHAITQEEIDRILASFES